MHLATAPILALALAGVVVGSPTHGPSNGTFVARIDQCPRLSPRKPMSVHDLRPDQIQVIGGLGDSIMAGCFARDGFAEDRGISYSMGGDPDAISLPNMIKHYSSSLVGASLGRNKIPEYCGSFYCSEGDVGWNKDVDQFNAALSGAHSSHLTHQVNDFLVPQMKSYNVTDAFKLISLHIGSNDLCGSCNRVDGEIGPQGLDYADEYESNIRQGLEEIRKSLPNTVVNLTGLFKVTDQYFLSKDNPYCPSLPFLPYWNWLCPCSRGSSEKGARNRETMDRLMVKYNERLVKIVREYQWREDPSFAVLWQPANFTIAKWPIEGFSRMDCFHPSEMTHKFMATQLWNRLVAPQEKRSGAVDWVETADLKVRCLQEEDRFQTRALLE